MVSDSPNAFARNVIEILNDKALRNYLGYNARKLALEKYDWGIICNKLDTLYKNLFFEK